MLDQYRRADNTTRILFDKPHRNREEFQHENPLDTFLYSPKMKELYDQAYQYSLEPHSNSQYDEIIDAFKGAVVADFGERLVNERKRPQDIVYGGKETYEYFHKLYPAHQKAEFPFGVKTLQGIAVPDGMLFEKAGNQTILRAVYEYTSNPDMDNIRRKYEVFRYLKRDFPRLFINSRVIFVVPNNVQLSPDLLDQKDLGLVYLPFSANQFHTFTKSTIYTNYRPYGVTLYEIQKRQREQSKTGMIHSPSTSEHYPTQENTTPTYTPLNYSWLQKIY